MYRICCLLIAVLLSTPFTAAAQGAFCAPSTGVVYYGNGVLTEFSGAVDGLIAIQGLVEGRVPPDEYANIEFDLSMNWSDGVFEDLLEATLQDLQTDYSQFWRFVLNVLPMPDAFRDALAAAAAEFDQGAISNSDVAGHVLNYRERLAQGKKVIVVAHSQGNFFANQSYGILTASERGGFGIVSVAQPDSFVAGGGPYITFFDDLVIAAVRIAKGSLGLPEPMAPNAILGLGTGDLTGHYFVESYLGSAAGRSAVADGVADFLVTLRPPPTTVGSGIITVTLTWGSQPDVDLHAFEPDGFHVYYAQRQGPSGFLDVDDVTGFGPEHYFVGCATLEVGTYTVGVNYFNGSAPETATVQISAGDIIRTRSIPLSTAIGSSGNASPVFAGAIDVTIDPVTGEYRFVVR